MISLIHKTIFIHIPKCAGQSVEEAFLHDLNLNWESHRHLLGCFEKPASWSDALPPRLAHATAADHLQHDLLPEPMFRSFYKFAIVRDPVERVISMWRYLRHPDIDEFIRLTLPKRLAANDYWRRPQKRFVTSQHGELLVDDIVPFSRLQEKWPAVRAKAGLNADLPHRNRAPAKWARPEISNELRELVRHAYAEDYSYFQEF